MLSVLVIVLALALLLFVIPVWTFIDAAIRTNRGEKLAWLVASVLLWPLAGVAYGLFRTRSRALRAVTTAVVAIQIGVVWIGHRNSVDDASRDSASFEHYEAVRETSTLELTDVFGAYGSQGNDDYVQQLSLSGDGARVLVSGGRSLRLWDVADGVVVRTYERLPANDILAGWLHGKWLGRGSRIALSDDGNRVAAERGSVTLRLGWTLLSFLRDAVVGRSHVVNIWTGEDVTELRAHNSNITNLAFFDERLMTSSFDGTLAMWDVASLTQVFELEPQRGWIHASAISPNQRFGLISARDPYAVENSGPYLGVWDLTAGSEKFILSGHDDTAHAASFTHDGRRALTASFDGFREWDLENGEELRFIPGNDKVFDVAFSANGRYALAGRNVLYLWDLQTRSIVDEIALEACDDKAGGAVFSADGSFVLIGTSRGAILRFRRKDEGAQFPVALESVRE